MSELSDLLRERNTLDWGPREIEHRAAGKGHRLTAGTVTRYFKGQHGRRPHEETLRAFHDVLGIPMGQLVAAAGLTTAADLGEFEPHQSAHLLETEERAAVNEIIRLLTQRRVSGDGTRTPSIGTARISESLSPGGPPPEQPTTAPTPES